MLRMTYRARMNGRSLAPLLEGGAFFESPRWHEGRWWVSDFYRQAHDAVLLTATVEVRHAGLP